MPERGIHELREKCMRRTAAPVTNNSKEEWLISMEKVSCLIQQDEGTV